MALMFLFPSGGETEEDTYLEEGRIKLIETQHEPYEVSVEFRGFSYHLIFGSQINGNFVCIPWLHIGAELANYRDLRWNTDSLKRCGLKDDMAEMFAQSLNEVSDYLE